MDITIGSGNLLLLASLSSYVSATTDGISITGNAANSSMVHAETMDTGEVGAAIDTLPMPSDVADASIAERETSVPSSILEEVTDGGVTGGDATDPLLPPEGLLVQPEKGL